MRHCRQIESRRIGSRRYENTPLECSADIVALCEHWLWSFELSDLNKLHDYTSFGQADNRLNEHSLLN